MNGRDVAGFPYQNAWWSMNSNPSPTKKQLVEGYETLPTTQIATLQALALVADQALTVRLDGQSDAGIVLSAGGLLLLLDITADASPPPTPPSTTAQAPPPLSPA